MSKNKVKKMLKQSKILRKLYDERVLSITTSRDEILLKEMCDEWFEVCLNKKECLELSELFKNIANEMQEREVK